MVETAGAFGLDATMVFVALGLGAGVLTTVAGQGGGLVLLLACSAILGPHRALAVTTPALLLGNAHRVMLLRTHVDRPIAARLIVGVLPGALVGGIFAGAVPPWTLRVALVSMTAVAVAKAVGWLRFQLQRSALVPAGFLAGSATGTAGGAGLLFAPILLSTGLTGRAYVATSAAAAVAAHVGRMVGYASFGLFSGALIGPTVAVTLAIFAGNALGDRLAPHVFGVDSASGTGVDAPGGGPAKPSRSTRWSPELRAKLIEYGTLVLCVVLSVAGLG